MTDATVRLWGTSIGAVSWLRDQEIGVFQFDPGFLDSGIELAPVMMPLGEGTFSFPSLPRETFKGLPGMLADSLPDRFGNRLIDAWLAREGRSPSSFNPVERLCYIGSRGMGALEFHPAISGIPSSSRAVRIDRLVELVNEILQERAGLVGKLSGSDGDGEVLEDILKVGTSAGGAGAKAVIAWNEKTGEFRSGQLEAQPGFTHWLLKFDGVSNNRDRELADPLGFGRIEYACHLMAMEAGIDMMTCRLHHENGRSHFMTRRFDRTDDGGRLHMQSLSALMHYDFNEPGAYSYEQAIRALRLVDASHEDVIQQALRAVFNIAIRNQDDHAKNIAFLMDRSGQWRLSPAFDVCYAYNPTGEWTNRHQMSLNGKRDGFGREDFLRFFENVGIKPAKGRAILNAALEARSRWKTFAHEAGVPEADAARIEAAFRAI
ncbi:type II toxin-antitoxin system HipA family toxin [Pseudaminobacter arsenicus]|uniref:Type II toxin-antitoxin system HipA family toxin n=1 Tax=Borborobacter arsenicus TaxID=1851146 RepID=A0A432V7U7_9HYPH|nr:type II toxin-antitoxin system HipA family toxin [Pseudaminobacter arsenicus]RUM98244.1 type II toxin-antitoxin system HipA family toxin [Pseudaminobacter arsenicus]